MSSSGMFDPASYNRYHKLQQRENHRCLVENIHRMVWRGGDRVLDIGSGDGSFTANTLRRFLPDDIKLLVGCDKNEKMVEYANQHYQREGIKYQMVELTKTLPPEYTGSFDHVFAFHSVHWMKDQRAAFSQIYDILSEGGDCLLLLGANAPFVYDVARWFTRSHKWGRWVDSVEHYESPYHDCIDPETTLKNMANDIGFKDVYVKCNKQTFTFDTVEDCKSFIRGINTFNIPEELFEEYLEEGVKYSKHQGYITDDNTVTYTNITFFARK